MLRLFSVLHDYIFFSRKTKICRMFLCIYIVPRCLMCVYASGWNGRGHNVLGRFVFFLSVCMYVCSKKFTLLVNLHLYKVQFSFYLCMRIALTFTDGIIDQIVTLALPL